MANAPAARARDAVDIEAYLAAADPKLALLIKAVVARIGVQRITVSKATHFEALVRAIIYQSVSTKAAAAIYARMQQTAKPLTPNKVLALSQEAIRTVGLSTAKVRSIRALAEWFDANRKRAKGLGAMSDADVVEALTEIPGIGPWTANVFLIFSLGREDVIPAADLGIRRGVQSIDAMNEIASAATVLERAKSWQPYRSIASIYLWQVTHLGLTRADLR